MPEGPAPVQTFFESRPPSIRALVEAVDRAARDRRVKGLLLRVKTLGTGWGRAQELRDALVRFRRSGKPSWAHLEDASNLEYFLATGCSKIAASPTSTRRRLGPLGRGDLLPRSARQARSRGAVRGRRPLQERPEPDDGDGLHRAAPRADERARGLAVRPVRGGDRREPGPRRTTPCAALVDRGPFRASEAKQAGLVDELLYRDEVETRVPGCQSDERRGLRARRARGCVRPPAAARRRVRGR